MKKAELVGKQKNKKGFTTLEILIACVFLVLMLGGVIVLVFNAQSLSIDSRTNEEALYKAQEQLEKARALGRKSFFALADIGANYEGIYNKILDVEWVDDYLKKVTSKVIWNTESYRNQQKIELTTIVTNWEGAIRGDTCDPQLSGNWQDPQVISYIDIVSNKGATDLDTRMHKVYLTTDPSAADKPDFYIIDVSEPQNPQIKSQLNTGNGLEAVKVAGRATSVYAYVGNRSINAQLQIIDVTNPENPFLAASLKMPGVSGNGYGKSIYYLNEKVYLGLYKAEGPEFHIIDVSNPLIPNHLGSFEINATVNNILVRDNVAYLAITQPDPDNNDEKNLIILDVSNSSNIQLLSTFSPPTTLTQSGQSLFLDGKTLYFGRSDGTKCNNCHELYILDLLNMPNISIRGSKKIGSTINAVVLRQEYLFMMTGDPNEGFQIWNVSNPSNITKYTGKNVAQVSTAGFDCEGNLMYFGQRSNRALQIISATNVPPPPPPFDYALNVQFSNLAVKRGFSATNNVTVTLTNGSPQSVTLSVSDLPNRVNVDPTSASCVPNNQCQVTFNFSAASNAKKGTYVITINGISPPKSVNFQLIVE